MIVLSFDIEEFDLPTEYGFHIGMDEQISVSEEGLSALLDILEERNLPATFYSTVRFLESISPDLLQRIVDNPLYEIASHGMRHDRLSNEDLGLSRSRLRALTGREVTGFRAQRMQPVSSERLLEEGYSYSASINPTWIPGRYNNLSKPATPYRDAYGLVQMPGPVTPGLHIPLFWLGLHHYPLSLYTAMTIHSARKMDCLQLYFHPWEFADWGKRDLGTLPYVVRKKQGLPMRARFASVVDALINKGFAFGTAQSYIDAHYDDLPTRF